MTSSNLTFVLPVCTIKSDQKQSSTCAIKSLVKGSSKIGFGAAEDLENFLHVQERKQTKDTKQSQKRKSSGSGSGARATLRGSNSSKSGRKPDCYVMSNHEVVMHRGF